MPELPELEVMSRVLRGSIVGRPILQAESIHPGILKTVDPGLTDLLKTCVGEVHRLGKHLVLSIREDLHVVIHLMVAGRIVLCGTPTALTKATAFRLSFEGQDDLRVIENATLHQAAVHLVRDPIHVALVANAGVDPLSHGFTLATLEERIGGKRRQLKHLLMDQTVVSGIGSTYADEILFRAKLSPIRYALTLSEEEMGRLFASVQETLQYAIQELDRQSGGATLTPHDRPFLRVVKRTGTPCPECGGRIAEIRYAQTKTYYCPTCQLQGRTANDRRAWLRQ